MSFDAEKNVASKCFLCDGDPKCVKARPTEAIRYVPGLIGPRNLTAVRSMAICLRTTTTNAVFVTADFL